MSKIQILSQETINQIAAGEVVERPMAVVKELVENAMDAGATSVTVEIRDGGKSLIRITDNGSGMTPEDIPLAFTPHATSKIASAQDLMNVHTLGFRGEALASIASVSQMELITKTREQLVGSRYVIEGGQEKSLEEVGCPEGTTILVRNLFYNTPARLKFLKTPPTEAGYISSMLEHMALSHPDVSFRFINQNNTRLHTSGNGNLKDVIYPIYGREITANLVEVSASEISCHLSGFIGKPAVSRGNRTYMNYFINGRYIKSNVVQKAIEDAYQPYVMQHRYPFTVLHIQIDPTKIDVNVHPQKMELRFTDSQGVYQSIYHAVSEALRFREPVTSVSLDEEKKETKTKKTQIREPEIFEKMRQEALERAGKAQAVRNSRSAAKEQTASNDLVREHANYQTAANTDSMPEDRFMKKGSAKQVLSHETQAQAANVESSAQETQPLQEPNLPQEETSAVPKPAKLQFEQQTMFHQGILSEQGKKECQIIGQVFGTYWILQYEDSMYMVDQHAAHEKVLYERFMKKILQHEVMTQQLQPPIIVSLSMAQEEALSRHGNVLEQLGYVVEPFGGHEYAVTGVPAHLPDVGESELLKEIIDTLAPRQGHETPEILRDRVATMSCKAAVKGGNVLPVDQMKELFLEMMACENPYHCPHGRPTMIKMTRTEIDKKFKRIV